jgi:hypothetical protein
MIGENMSDTNNPADYISDFNVNGLDGRVLYMPARALVIANVVKNRLKSIYCRSLTASTLL